MLALPASPRTGAFRPWGAGTAAVLLGVGLAVAPSAPAHATAVCASTAPALDALVTCTSAGTQDITVPTGATAVHLKVTGGGGGGSRAVDGWASGGKGAVTSGWATLPLGTSFLRVYVGAGGAAGVAGTGDTLGGGGGGGGSGVFAYSATSVMLGTLVITGGGGGAGGQDVSTTVTGGGAGGNAGAAGTGYGGDYSANAGAAASGVNGGAGGTGDHAGTAGGGATWGAIASGGTGASIGTRRAGNGGGGYSGGGGGAAQDLALAGSAGTVTTQSTGYLGGGGGGGGNYTNTGAMPARWFGHAGSSGAGSGGTGLAVSDAASMSDGGAGAIEAKFVEVVPTPAITSISPTTGLLSGGGTLTITGTDLEGTQSVMVGALVCGSVVVVSPTQVTCTIPTSALAGAVDVSVVSPRGVSTPYSSYTYGAAPTVVSVSPTSGPLAGGGTLTITGTNLTATSSVTVGGDACTSVVVVSATEVTCTLPEKLESGTFDVVATTPIGSGTKAAAYEYVETPTVTSISPVTGVLAGGGTLTVNGTLLTGTSAVSLGGAACTSISNVSATQVTCTIPSRLTTGTVNLELTATAGTASLTSAYTYTQPAPTIVSVSPTSGLLAGGGTLTITGTNLSLTSSVMLGETECTNIVNVSATEVTCTIPAGTALGPVQVNVTTAGGFIGAAGAYTYVAAPIISPPITTPTTPPTTPPTTAPTPEPTPTETPTPTPSVAPRLQLTLDLEVNSPVVGAQAVMTGGGLLSKSKYVLTMRSTPVQVATGVTDDAGNFRAQIKLPSKVCVSGGLHELVLTGITPEGEALRDSSWIVLDDNCKTRSLRKAKPVNNTVTLGTFIFPYLSARLTPHSKSVLRGLRSPIRSAKRVTITGYTQTTQKSKAAKKFNRGLAKRRAAAVRAYLTSVGIKAPITIVGAGGVKPLKGKAQKYNRRVVITVRY